MRLWTIAIIVFLINLPFGYWRANTKKYSLQWFIAIHAPIPLIIVLRIFTHLGWKFTTFPVLIGAFFLGQLLGGKLHSWCKKHTQRTLTSCLIYDAANCLIKNIKTKSSCRSRSVGSTKV